MQSSPLLQGTSGWDAVPPESLLFGLKTNDTVMVHALVGTAAAVVPAHNRTGAKVLHVNPGLMTPCSYWLQYWLPFPRRILLFLFSSSLFRGANVRARRYYLPCLFRSSPVFLIFARNKC